MNLNATTNGIGALEVHSAKDLRNVRITSGNGDPSHHVYRIAELEDFLKICSTNHITPFLDIKSLSHYDKFLTICSRYFPLNNIIFQGNQNIVKELRNHNASIPLMALILNECSPEELVTIYRPYHTYMLNLPKNQINIAAAEYFSKNNFDFCVYSIDSYHELDKMIALGARIIVTNTIDPRIEKSMRHQSDKGTVIRESTCEKEGEILYTCNICGKVLHTETLPALSHTCKTEYEAASFLDSGQSKTSCTRCGTILSTQKIAQIGQIILSNNSYYYNGKERKPRVKVLDQNGNRISSSEYVLTYPQPSIGVGDYDIKIKFKGKYTGTKKINYRILPPATKIYSISKQKKSISVKLKKINKMASGYVVQYSNSKEFNHKKSVIMKSKVTNKINLKRNLFDNNVLYYFRARTYYEKNEKKYYSCWSDIQTVIFK